MTKTKNGYLIVQVPMALRAEFKVHCAQKGKSMRETVVALLEREIKRVKP